MEDCDKDKEYERSSAALRMQVMCVTLREGIIQVDFGYLWKSLETILISLETVNCKYLNTLIVVISHVGDGQKN